jgi:LacI family transcriptional regulator
VAHKRSSPTILDVAAAAGVSVTTVSRVLNEKGDVSAGTAQRVREVIDELNYESSLAARSMRSHRTQVIGIILPDMDHSYAVEVVRSASRAITGRPYDLFAMTSGSRGHDERGRWEQQQVSRLNGTLADGVIVVVPDAREFRTDHPLVALDSYKQSNSHPSVISDGRQGTLDLMAYLFGLGHRRIGYIGGLEYLQSAVQRRLAWEESHRIAGVSLDLSLALEGTFSIGSGIQGLRTFLGMADPPTAIFAANDDTAFGVLAEARLRGIRVPEDLSVAGFDNVPEAAVAMPPLTTVNQGIEHMVLTAVEMLIDLIEGVEVEEPNIILPTFLVVRESCARPPEGRMPAVAVVGKGGQPANLSIAA